MKIFEVEKAEAHYTLQITFVAFSVFPFSMTEEHNDRIPVYVWVGTQQHVFNTALKKL